MSFGAIQATNKGRILRTKALTGVQIVFTRLAVGDGELGGQAIDDLNALIHQVKAISITELKTLTGGKATVKGVLTNEGLSVGFYWRELGLFAQDPDVGEILYCYGNAGALAEYIPASGAEILEKQVGITSIVGNASSISAVIDQSMIFATQQDLDIKISHSLATSVNDFLVASGVGQFVKKTLAEVKAILGLGSAAYTDSSAYATAAQGAKADGSIQSGLASAVDQVMVSAGIGAWAVKSLAQFKTWLGLGSAAYTSSVAYATAAQGTTADNAASSITTHQSDYTLQVPFATTSGSANIYTATLSPALTAYTAGVAICVKINAANTGASTININGLGAKTVLDSKGNALTSGKLRLNGVYTLRYDGTNFILQGEGASGNATASDLLSGKTASVDAGDITGTLALTGTAATGDVVNGRTFYNTDAKTMQTRTMPDTRVSAGANTTLGSSSYRQNLPYDGSYLWCARCVLGKVRGTVRVSFEISGYSYNDTAYGYLTKNGVIQGSIVNTQGHLTTTMDIQVRPGDQFDVYGRCISGYYQCYAGLIQIFISDAPFTVFTSNPNP